MTRMADLILNSRPPSNLLVALPHGDAPGASAAATTIAIVVADSACEFLFAVCRQEHWEFERDFPDRRYPSWPIFVEMGRPSRVVSHVHGLNDAAIFPERWGWRLEATRYDRLAAVLQDPERGPIFEGYFRRYVDRVAGSGLVDVAAVERALDAPDTGEAVRKLDAIGAWYFAAVAICRALGRLKAGVGPEARGGLGWLLHGTLVIERDGRVLDPVATMDLILDREGRPVPPPFFNALGGEELTDAEKTLLRATVMPLAFPALLALSLLNTNGATLRAVEPSPGFATGHREQAFHAPLRYHILDLGGVADVDRN